MVRRSFQEGSSSNVADQSDFEPFSGRLMRAIGVPVVFPSRGGQLGLPLLAFPFCWAATCFQRMRASAPGGAVCAWRRKSLSARLSLNLRRETACVMSLAMAAIAAWAAWWWLCDLRRSAQSSRSSLEPHCETDFCFFPGGT